MAKNPTMSLMDSMKDRTAAKAAHPLAHVLALNNDPGIGMKANRMPGPLKPVQAFAKGGAAKLVQFYAKGGAVKDAKCMAKGGKAKGGKKVVMGTMKEAADVMNALKSVKKPMTPPPGLGASSPMVNPRMAAPPMPPGQAPMMKKGGKVKRLAAGGAAKVRKSSPMPDKIKKVPYVNGG